MLSHPSFKILITLKAQLTSHLFGKINPNPKSKLIILFPNAYQHVVCLSGISLCLAVNHFTYYLSVHPHRPLGETCAWDVLWTLMGTQEMP